MSLIRLRLLGGVELSALADGREHRLSVAPKPLALLAYLAVAHAGRAPVRRDVLLALFWPELPTDRARGALRQLLFQLRRALGDAALLGDRETIALAADRVECDVAIFEECLARGERAQAMDVHKGSVLEGFFVDGMSIAFEEWVAGARARLNGKAFAACSTLADDAEQAGNGVAAARWARAAAALAPDDEPAVRRLIQTLDKFGDRCGALRVADDFTRRLSVEFDASPSAETEALIAAVRARRTPLISAVAEPMPRREAPEFAAAPDTRQMPGSIDRGDLAAPVRRPPAARALRRRALGATFAVIVVAVAFVATRRGGAAPGPSAPSQAMAPPITIASVAARGLYDQGLDRYNAGDQAEAARLLTAALAADTNCAMCAYYAAMANSHIDDEAAERLLQRANRLASRVSEPERLLIGYRLADATNSFARRIMADSLVARYPRWPEAQVAAAEAANMDGRWLEAGEHLRRAIAAEPRPDSTSNAECAPCSTRLLLIVTYEAADSLPAALRVAQAFVREQPHARLAWLQLSHALAASGRYPEARAAMDSSTRYATGTVDDVGEHASIEIRARNFSTADRLLTTLTQTGNANSRTDALWGLIISLRAQGRLHEALALSRGEFRRADASATQGNGVSLVAEAQLEFELGQYRQAAASFERLAIPLDSFVRAAKGRDARQHAWMLTQAGSAFAAAGDTARLAALVDTVRAWGMESGFERDHRLHDYLTGLLWSARGRPDSAAAAFARATVSETDGFGGLDLERAKALLALGRPAEAVSILRHSLAGPLEAGNFYSTPTEVEEALAGAYEAAGQPDSAAAYYGYVVTAWRGADAQFRPRVAHARERMIADERRSAAKGRS